MKKTKTKTKVVGLPEKAEEYVKQEKKLLEKLDLAKRIVVMFPHRRNKKPPFLGKLALSLLKWSGGQVDIQFLEAKDVQNHG